MTLELYSGPEVGVDEEIVYRARNFARTHIKPNAEQWELKRIYPESTVRAAMAEFGGLIVSTDLGGKGITPTTFFRVLEEFAKEDVGFSIAFVVQCNVGLVVSMSDNQALRDKFLPGLMDGRLLGSFCLTEPHTGSDAAAIHTFAQEHAGIYLISGTKAWIINAAQADVVAVFAKTKHDPGTQDIALFLTEAKRPGISASAPYELGSGNATAVADLTFEKVDVSPQEMLFGPGAGFKAAMQALDAARVGIAAICNGALTAGLEHALDYAASRQAFGSPLIAKQGVQWCFADHVTQLEASRLLTFKAAAMLDNGQAPTILAAHAKKFANHAVVDGLVWAMRSMGANGLRRENKIARQLASAQILFHTDGTPEILNLVIGRALSRPKK